MTGKDLQVLTGFLITLSLLIITLIANRKITVYTKPPEGET